MALGCFYIWTYTYQLIRNSSAKLKTMKEAENLLKELNKDFNANEKSHLLNDEGLMVYQQLTHNETKEGTSASRIVETLQKILEELLAPPTIGAVRSYYNSLSGSWENTRHGLLGQMD